jgi:cell pole-organizing protein PopZ
LFDFFKPTVETNETCKKKYDKCLDKVAGKEDNNFFKLPTLNFFGSSDSAATTVKGDEGGGEFEMEEYPVAAAPPAEPVSPAPAEPVSPAPAEPVVAAEQEDNADLNLDEITNETLAASAKDAAAEQEAAAAAAAEQAAAAAAAAAAEQEAAAAKQEAAAAAAAEQKTAAASQGITPGLDDVTTLSPPPFAEEYGLTGQPSAKTEAEKNARINNSMGVGMGMGMVQGVGSGGGSRKKYKKRNANRSKKNKNRRNKKRTNKRN